MAEEKVVKTERDFWGNKKESVYEGGRKTGEIKTETRGGFFGVGGKEVRVERNNSGQEVSHTKREDRGGIFGVGGKTTDVTYDRNGKETGTSRVEERGGFFGIGAEHVRVERDAQGREVGETRWERRGDFFGIGGERVRVTRETASSRSSRSSGTARGGYTGESSSATQSSGIGMVVLAVVAVAIVMFAVAKLRQPAAPPAVAPAPAPTPRVQPAVVEQFHFARWPVGKSVTFTQSHPFRFCTRPCSMGGASKGVDIRLASITKASDSTVQFTFEATTPEKPQQLAGGIENQAKSDFLLFVEKDSYTTIGYGSSAQKHLYAKAIHLLDDKGGQIRALRGIEGLSTSGFNDQATRAALPFGTTSRFHVSFSVPSERSTNLTFVSPSLDGHQGSWRWKVYDAVR